MKLLPKWTRPGAPKTLENLELHVVHGCNLTCESCSHYSNHGLKGMLAPEEAGRWMMPWARRLAPRTFSLLGGEPTLHPELTRFIGLARLHWRRSEIRLVTNGFFLDRHPDLPRALASAGKSVLEVSIHHASDEYRARMEPVFDLLRSWRRRFGIRIVLTHSYANWTRRYKGFGSAMAPYEDGRPRQSWEHCPAKYCRQLMADGIAKCGPLAYLKMQDEKFRLSEKWRPYLDYQLLKPTCSDAELADFLSRQEEPYCGMCPAAPERFDLPVPFRSSPARQEAAAS